VGLSLAIDTDAAGRFRATPRGRRRPLTGLSLSAAGVAVDVPGCEPVTLAWEDYGQLDPVLDGKPPRDGWMIAPWSSGRAGAFGVGVRVCGRHEVATAPHAAAATTGWLRITGAKGSNFAGRSLPVLPGGSASTMFTAERWTLIALCALVHSDPQLQTRLDEPERMQQLARDVQGGMRTLPPIATGLGHDATDIHFALLQGGFVHRFGRPLTTSELPPLDQVADDVAARLAANPQRAGRVTERAELERIIRQDFHEVEPWPFAALIADGGAAT
jgi:hypothetical protein